MSTVELGQIVFGQTVQADPMSRRAKKTSLIALIAGLLLFAQYAIAAQGCKLDHAWIPGTSQQAADRDCDGVPMSGSGCLAHCLSLDEQSSSLDHHFFTAPAASSPVPAGFVLAEIGSIPRPAAVQLPAGPPLQVLYCSYQT